MPNAISSDSSSRATRFSDAPRGNCPWITKKTPVSLPPPPEVAGFRRVRFKNDGRARASITSAGHERLKFFVDHFVDRMIADLEDDAIGRSARAPTSAESTVDRIVLIVIGIEVGTIASHIDHSRERRRGRI